MGTKPLDIKVNSLKREQEMFEVRKINVPSLKAIWMTNLVIFKDPSAVWSWDRVGSCHWSRTDWLVTSSTCKLVGAAGGSE